MTHGEAAHERGTHNMFTGLSAQPGAAVSRAWAAWSRHEYGPQNNLPPYVCIPSMPNDLRRHRLPQLVVLAVQPGQRPGRRRLPGPGPEPARRRSTTSRFATRRNVLDAVNDHFAKKEKSDDLAAMDTFYERAYSLISSQKAREAFNIDAEPATIRDEYGRNAAGQRMLMARRLVAAGVRFVTLTVRRLGHAHRHRRAACRARCPPSTRRSPP